MSFWNISSTFVPLTVATFLQTTGILSAAYIVEGWLLVPQFLSSTPCFLPSPSFHRTQGVWRKLTNKTDWQVSGWNWRSVSKKWSVLIGWLRSCPLPLMADVSRTEVVVCLQLCWHRKAETGWTQVLNGRQVWDFGQASCWTVHAAWCCCQ